MTMRRFCSAVVGAAALLVSSNASAVYNANMSGVVTELMTYADGDYIYLRLSAQPATHPSCLTAYFVIPASVPADRRKAMFAQLMVAKLTGEPINLGYDNAGDCADGYIRVHRVG